MSQPATPPPQEGARRPLRVEPVAGSQYGLAIYGPPPAISGQAVGALVAGVASILVSLVVACFGFLGTAAAMGGQPGGWGPLVGGAFAILATFLGVAGVGLGIAGFRQVNRAARSGDEAIRGRPMAIAGAVCGGVGIVISLCSMGLAGPLAFG